MDDTLSHIAGEQMGGRLRRRWPAASDKCFPQHMIMGMQTVWVFGDPSDILKLPRPRVEGYLTYGGGERPFPCHCPSYSMTLNRRIRQCHI
jgi:hypothetical protein